MLRTLILVLSIVTLVLNRVVLISVAVVVTGVVGEVALVLWW